MFPTRIAHLDLTAFYVSVEQVLNPELIGKPIMVAHAPESRGVVTCASYAVRKYGIHAGMPTSVAMRNCPHAIRIDGHFEVYQEYSDKVQQFLKNYAPVFETAGMDEFYLDWTGCERLFGGNLYNFARSIQNTIFEKFGLPCSIGIASNKILAKVACAQAKPIGVSEVKPGLEAEYLKALNAEVLPGAGEVTLKKMRRRGIQTCGQLAKLNMDYVGQALGLIGLKLQNYTRGFGPQYLTTVRKQKQISTERTFASDTRDKRFLHDLLHKMVLKVSQEMRALDLRAGTVHVKLRYSDWITHTRQIRVPAVNDPGIIYQTARSLFVKADNRRVSIRLIGVGLSAFSQDITTIDMFRQDEERREWLIKTVDKINYRYKKKVRIGCGI